MTTTSHLTELERAFESAGRISEAIVALELFAADLDDDVFSADVAKIREVSTRSGNRLAQLLRVERGR